MTAGSPCSRCGALAAIFDVRRLDEQWVFAYYRGTCRHIPPAGRVWVVAHPPHDGRCDLDDHRAPCRALDRDGGPCRDPVADQGRCARHAEAARRVDDGSVTR